MRVFTILFACLLLQFDLFSQENFKGIVKSSTGNLTGASVVNQTKNITTITDSEGKFTIQAAPGDKIRIGYVGYTSVEIVVDENFRGRETEIILTQDLAIDQVVVVGSVSPKSKWVTAKVGYNFDGFSEDDENEFIGAAKIVLNALKEPPQNMGIGIIGNIGDFITKENKEEGNKNLEQLVLSVRGLHLGGYAQWYKTVGSKSYFSTYLTAGYRLNSFKKVGKDSITVNLSQLKTTIGIEFEGLEFAAGGNINLSIEGSLYKFDPNRYETIFGQKKSFLTSLEASVILPISNKFGFFATGTYAPNFSAVHQIGIIVKQN